MHQSSLTKCVTTTEVSPGLVVPSKMIEMCQPLIFKSLPVPASKWQEPDLTCSLVCQTIGTLLKYLPKTIQLWEGNCSFKEWWDHLYMKHLLLLWKSFALQVSLLIVDRQDSCCVLFTCLLTCQPLFAIYMLGLLHMIGYATTFQTWFLSASFAEQFACWSVKLLTRILLNALRWWSTLGLHRRWWRTSNFT